MNTTNHQNTVPLFKRALTVAAVAALTTVATQSGIAANLLARWTLNEASSPYADSGPNGIQLLQDAATTTAISGSGVSSNSAELNWQSPGPATRLSANGAALQTDSFGFSLWIQPVYLDQFNEILGKEMVYTNLANFLRMSWQLQVGGKNPTNDSAPLELVVRGNNRNVGDFFGNVISSTELPLFASSTNWVHIVGGYDAASGSLSIWVNGAGSFNGGTPGADNSDGSPLSIGTGLNGSDYVAFSAGAKVDEVQIYGSPLLADEVAYLRANPGKSLADRGTPGITAYWKFEEATPPFTNSVAGFADMLHDDMGCITSTPPRFTTNGLVGHASGFDYNNPPDWGTRLYCTNTAVANSDSFGFSFWVRGQGMNPFNPFLTKEIAGPIGIAPWEKLAWTVQLIDPDTNNTCRIEFLVRGSDGANGRWYGAVGSGNRIPLTETNENVWYHIAGGYDAQSGAMAIYVNGGSDSAIGTPGANNSNPDPLVLGSAQNGCIEKISFSPGCYLDEVQIYNGILTAAQAALLRNNPGKTLGQLVPFSIHNFAFNSGTGDMQIVYNSVQGQSYTVRAATNLTSAWLPVSSGIALGSATTNLLTKAQLDAALGATPRSQTFLRVSAP